MGTDENTHLKKTTGTQCSVAEKVLKVSFTFKLFWCFSAPATVSGILMFGDQMSHCQTPNLAALSHWQEDYLLE